MRYMILTKKSLLVVAMVVLVLGVGFYTAAAVNRVALANTMEERKVPIYSVETEKSAVAITFNAAWEAEEVPEILQILEDYGAKCTFFVLGEFVDKNPEAVKLIGEAGHEIANHSDTHPDMTVLDLERITEEITACDAKIQEVAGESFVPLFRAPSGAYSNQVLEAAEALDRQVIQWDVDSRDWMESITRESLVQFALTGVENGSILLFHVGTKKGYTPQALPEILENLRSQGYEFVKVSELIYPNDGRSYVDAAGVQHPG